MKYLKFFDNQDRHLKLFESNIVIPNYHSEVVNKYLDELGITLDELNDIFIELLDNISTSYLQVFYVAEDGTRWITLDHERIKNGIYSPHLDISFSSDIKRNDDVKSLFSSTYYEEDTDVIKNFISGIDRLKDMFPKKEIKWTWYNTTREQKMSVCIYFEDIKVNR